jgi:hypothetical protein
MVSPANTAVEPQQRIEVAVKEFKKRLASKGVALDESKDDNVLYLANYIKKNGLDVGNPDHLEQAYRALAPKGLLIFLPGKEPAALKPKTDTEKLQPAWVDQNKRTQAAKKVEVKEAEAKAEEQARVQTEMTISSYSPTDARRGVIAYGKKDAWEKAARKFVAQFRQQGHNWQAIAKWAKTELDAQYKRDENQASRM